MGFPSSAGTSIDPSRTVYLGRTLGMGGAHTALSDDGEGLFTNPAGLGETKYLQMSGVSRRLFLDETAYFILGFSMPTEYGHIGLGYASAYTTGSYATTRDNDNRIIINPSLEVMAYDSNVILLSYAKNFPQQENEFLKKLSLGCNLKFFNQSITGGNSGAKGTGINLDIGVMYNPVNWLKSGLNLQNMLGGSINWNNSSDKIGGYYKLGFAANVLGASTEALYKHEQKLIAAFDYDLPHDSLDSAALMHVGLEWLPIKNIALRCGLNQESQSLGLTLGLGLIQGNFRFDYAYAARPGISGDNPHYFSISYIGSDNVKIEKSLKKKESAIKVIEPADRYITSMEIVKIITEPKFAVISEEKKIWESTGTSEAAEIKEFYDLTNVYVDGKKIEQTGTVEVNSQPMKYGRNVIYVTGVITPDSIAITTEVKVLRFDPFKDTEMTYWAITPIALNSEIGLIKGYPDNTFRPEKGITRAELLSLLIRTLNVSPEALDEASIYEKFTDVPKDNWALPYIKIGSDMGLVEGYPDGTFKPNRVLARAEGIAIIARYANLPTKEGIAFSDLKEDFWANKYILPAKESGWLNYLKEHYEKDIFSPEEDFSRAEASYVLYKTAPVQKMVDDFWMQGATEERGKVPEWMLPKNEITTIEAVPQINATTEVKAEKKDSD